MAVVCSMIVVCAMIVASVADVVVAGTGTADTVGGTTPDCDLDPNTDGTDACPAGCTETATSVVTLRRRNDAPAETAC